MSRRCASTSGWTGCTCSGTRPAAGSVCCTRPGTRTGSTILYAEATSAQELERYKWLAAPLLYRQWNAAAQAQTAAEPAQFAQPATEGFYNGFEPDQELPERLAALTAPVLIVAGEYDIWPTSTAVRRLAALFGNADLAVLPRIGHFPWVDDPGSFVTTVNEFLARGSMLPQAL